MRAATEELLLSLPDPQTRPAFDHCLVCLRMGGTRVPPIPLDDHHFPYENDRKLLFCCGHPPFSDKPMTKPSLEKFGVILVRASSPSSNKVISHIGIIISSGMPDGNNVIINPMPQTYQLAMVFS